MHHAARLCPGLLAFFSAGVFAADLRVDLDRLADELEPKVIEWRHDTSSRFFVEDSAMKLGVRALPNLTVDFLELPQTR